MSKSFFLLACFLLNTSLIAKEHYVYKASVLGVFKAKLIIDLEEVKINSESVLLIKSNSKVNFMGNEIVNLDYQAINDFSTFEPRLNIECEHSEKRSEQNCRAIKFLDKGQFLYKKTKNNQTVLADIELGDPLATLHSIQSQQPTYDPNEHKVFDIASIFLLVKYLDLNNEHREIELFTAVNHQITKVKVSYVQDLDDNKIWLKLTPIWPGPENYKTDFPHKIIYDKNLKAVLEVHKKLPYVGDVVIKLDEKSSFID